MPSFNKHLLSAYCVQIPWEALRRLVACWEADLH